MSKFYSHVHMRGNRIYLRGFDLGLRVKEVVEYNPYMFLPSKNGTFRTLDGTKVEKRVFDSISDTREFARRYEDVENVEIYGLTAFPYLFIYDNYPGEIDYDPALVNIGTIDIECAADEGFPDIQKADKEITAITVRCRKRNYVFGCGDFVTDDPNTFYFKCGSEQELLSQFLKCWQALDLDIVTGWNIEFFDIPYLVNRLLNLGFDPKKLSPWRMLDEKSVEFLSLIHI